MAVEEARPVAVAAMVVAEAAKVGVPAVLAQQKKTPDEGLAHRTKRTNNPAALLYPH